MRAIPAEQWNEIRKGVSQQQSREIYRKTKEHWPSARLHDVASKKAGKPIDERRLLTMAGFIEGLGEMAPTHSANKHWAPGPLVNLKQVQGSRPVLGYALTGGGDRGIGMECIRSDGKGTQYYLTGFGVMCWAWGQSNGLESCADFEMHTALDNVLTAEPVRRHRVHGALDLDLNTINTMHVAAAIRYFVERYKEADVDVKAWEHALATVRLPDPAPKAAASEQPAEVVPMPAKVSYAPDARFRVLMSQERLEDAKALCEEVLAGFKTWQRRLRMVEAGLEEDA